jgi:hypothetical protein
METLGRRAAFFLPLSLMGCRRTPTPESVSEAFIDRYYIERKPADALSYTVDLANQRVQAERTLLEQMASDSSGVQPRVYYKLLKSEQKGEMTQLSYALTIDSGGMDFEKQVRIDIVPRGKDFKVSFFNERDVAPGEGK